LKTVGTAGGDAALLGASGSVFREDHLALVTMDNRSIDRFLSWSSFGTRIG
jgi:hypothetical protein